ncbi:MAG TPA: cell surface protein SprA [Gemmatimonadales bacterium]
MPALCINTARAQSVTPDSVVIRTPSFRWARQAAFRHTMDDWLISPAPRPGWRTPSMAITGRSLGGAFDSTLSSSSADSTAFRERQHLFRKVIGQYAADTSAINDDRGLFGLSRNTVDMTFDGELTFQLSSARNRNLSCTPADVQIAASACRGGFTSPKIDNTILLQTSGTFLQRFHVDIAYNSKSDYAASNTIRVSYIGLEDEKLQRVDIGTVQLQPAPSRFLAASVPSNNFGISATAVFGPLTVQGIAATQKGSNIAHKVVTIGNGVVEPQDRLARDLDYDQGHAFWVIDPRTLAGYPALDILNAAAISVSPSVQPVDVRIYRYEAANTSAGANANYTGITATASNGTEQVGALRWRLLQPNVDYWIDPSGLWFMLTSNNPPSNYLAVSYRTRDGHLVGSLPTVDNPTAKDSLRLIYLPNRNVSSPLFGYEMRQLYRVAGVSLVRSSLTAAILVANSERPDSSSGTFLSLLGLAVPQNPAQVDVDNRVFPRARDAGASNVIKDAVLVFPSVTPFASPALGSNQRNDSLYRTPEYLLMAQGPPSVFQLHLQYNATSGSDRTAISLDALQIAEGSEQVTINGVLLKRSVDYTIDYATGRVSFLRPDSLFGNNTVTVDVTYEERGLFAQAPTSILGLSGALKVGDRKTINFMGLYQAEQTPYSRPQIGNEPRASLLAGVTADFTWNTPGLTSFLNHLTRTRSNAPSSVQLTGELAMSRPDANRSGDAYLEEFEDDHSILVSAFETRWLYGSLPQSARGLESVLPNGFTPDQAVQLIWQNAIPAGNGDSIAIVYPQQIDTTIAVTASTTPAIEPVLWLTLHADTAGGVVDSFGVSHWTQQARPNQPRWRTMTTALSSTGVDLSQNDYLQFALYENDATPIEQSQTKIVIDLGKVSEDEISVAPTNFSFKDPAHPNDTTFTGRQYVGLGRLDHESNALNVWDPLVNDIGILADRPDSLIGPDGVVVHNPALCIYPQISSTVTFYPWGDLGSHCSNRNNIPDTEDLDGDNVLDAQGPNDDVFRYVIDLHADSAKYFVRSYTPSFKGKDGELEPYLDNKGHSAHWTIYRVPLHQADDTIGSPDIHLIKQMRIAFVAPAEQGNDSVLHFALAMMKFTGSAWISRSPTPVQSLGGAVSQTHGAVTIGTISTQDQSELGYTSPPGVIQAAATVAVSQSSAPQQINEKSMRIQVNDLRPHERAEGYDHLPTTLNLLNYRTLRVWVHAGVGMPGWSDGRLAAYIKVGSDVNNFYLYRTSASTTSWDPEVVIDMTVWRALRDRVENQRLHQVPPSSSDWRVCGGDSTAYVACSGAYMVQVRDPLVNPPNLAAVQELAAGIYYPNAVGLPITHTELWVDDIRVSDPVSTTGYAGLASAHIQGADLFTLDLSGLYQDGNFHAMGVLPTYQNTTTLTTAATMRVDRFLPPSLGLVMPVSFTSSRGWIDPQLLASTDVGAIGLTGLRKPSNTNTAWTLSLRHPQRPGDGPLARYLVDPFSLSGAGSTGENVTSLSQANADNWSSTLSYFLSLSPRARSLHLRGLAASLPRWLRESTLGRGLAGGSYTLLPTALQFSSSLAHSMGELQSYSEPITTLADTILKPLTSEQYTWRNTAGVTWRPLGMINITTAWASTRDLRDYDDSTTLGRVVNANHRSLFGTDVGVERDRTVANTIGIAPHISSWINPVATIGTNFQLSRSLASRNPVRIDGDTAGAYILPQTIDNSRFLDLHLLLDPHLLMQRILGDSSRIARALTRFRPIDVSRRTTLESTFDLATFNPSLGYQLALGSFDSFLHRDGQQAIGAATGVTTSGTLSMILPGNFSADLRYGSTASDRYEQNGVGGFLESSGTTTAWPAGRMSWGRVFPGGFLTSVSASSSIERDRATSLSPFSDNTTASSVSDASRLSPNLVVIFRNGMSVTMNGEIDHSTATTNGNVAQTNALTVSSEFSMTTRMPRFVSATRRNMTASVRVTQNSSGSCVQQASDSACVSYYDVVRTEMSGTLSAVLEHGISAGFSGGYVFNNVRSAGAKTSTITLNIFIRLPLSGLGI